MSDLANYLPDDRVGFKESFKDGDPFNDYLKAIESQMPGGANIVGVLSARMKAMYQTAGLGLMGDRLTYAPGDRTVNFGNNPKVGLGAPIAYDIWYLYEAGNILKFGGKSIEESMAKMADYFEEVDDAKPLLSPESKPNSSTISNILGGGGGLRGGVSVSNDSLGAKAYTIKEARYEVLLTRQSAVYDSDGPKEKEGGDVYAGYIAFPVGPLGVMWGISLSTDSSLGGGGSSGSVQPVDGQNGTVQGGELLPPFDINKAEIAGEKLMSKGYLTEDDTKLELFAPDFAGLDNPELHKWLRYWIKKENTDIVPGEFVGLLCRPWPLHCWWYQETAPFVYAGHWLETEFYTSGIIKEVQVIDVDFAPDGDEVGNRYKIWVKNEEIIVKSTDFFEYEVDERVGLIKSWRTGSGEEAPFNWQGLTILDTGETLTREWVIAPAGFYED